MFTYRAYFCRLDVSLNKEALYDRERDFKKAEIAFRNYSSCGRNIYKWRKVK